MLLIVEYVSFPRPGYGIPPPWWYEYISFTCAVLLSTHAIYFVLSRSTFRLPETEGLDGYCECTMWNPASKAPILGKLYCSPNYICFSSKVCTVHFTRCIHTYVHIECSILSLICYLLYSFAYELASYTGLQEKEEACH